MSVVAFALSRNNAVVIAVTVVVTALVMLAIFSAWSHAHPEVVAGDRRRMLTPTLLLLIISVVMNGVGLLGVSVVTSDTNRVVGYVQQQTSPEQIRRQAETLDGVLVKVDCNAASRLQRGFDALAEQGLIEPVDVTLGCGHVQPTTTLP